MDIQSKDNIERLKSDLNQLHNTLSENIDLLLDREKNLNNLSDMASKLKMDSKNVKFDSYNFSTKTSQINCYGLFG